MARRTKNNTPTNVVEQVAASVASAAVAVKEEPKVAVIPSLDVMDEMGLVTKSAKIRYLDKEGFSRGEIAKHLGIIYQHVYNVLKKELKGPAATKAIVVPTIVAEPEEGEGDVVSGNEEEGEA